jgi:segregation and condensation protein B
MEGDMTDEHREPVDDQHRENSSDVVTSPPVDSVADAVPQQEDEQCPNPVGELEDSTSEKETVAPREDANEGVEISVELDETSDEVAGTIDEEVDPVDEAAEDRSQGDEGESLPVAADPREAVDDDETDDESGLMEVCEASEGPPPTVESVIEAILFATDEPLTDNRLANTVETTTKQVRQSIASLNAGYEENNNAFRIEQIAGGYQMLTLPAYNHWLKKMLRARSDTKLSPAALETLAIVAYKQPIIRADIEAIRGVAVGEVIRSLMYKGLVRIVGRAEILGRPMLYGTTKKFLSVFGLNSLKDLPQVEELKKPD